MNASNDTTLNTNELLERVRMTAGERLEARAALARGECIADALLAVAALFRSAKSGTELPPLARRKSFN